jgi:anaerobic magnesium-protoporphyrin IX monomethyl ester cyclase
MIETMTLVNLVPRLGGDAAIPLGPLYVTAALEQAGCAVDFRDYQLASSQNPLSQESLLGFLSESESTLGISCLFNALPFILPCLQRIKAAEPRKTIMLGGAGPSAVAETLMRRFPFIDVVVRGEGERTVLDMAQGRPYRDTEGIVYRAGRQVVVNPRRDRIDELDDLPFPAYHRVDPPGYDHAGIVTARGCPYRCSFCEVAPLWGHQTRRRSVANVVREIRLLRERYDVTTLQVCDDTFVLDRSWVLDFCQALTREQLGVTWRCLGRINLVDQALLRAMSDAGCVGIQYGVESGSQHVLDMVKKGISISQAVDVIRMTLDHIERVVCTFMWGFPFETMEDFFETVYLMGVAAQLGSSIKLLFLSPAPLSQLYREYSGELRFSEKLVSNLLWGVLGDTLPHDEKEQVLRLIVQNPDVFPGFFYFHTPDVERKSRILEDAGLIHSATTLPAQPED